MSTQWRDDAVARQPPGMGPRLAGRSMGLIRLWWLGVTRPGLAFGTLRARSAPRWGFWVVVAFNIVISCTSLLALYLLGRGPQMASALTFLPTEQYLLAEMFFLPPLRVAVWLLASAVIHVGVRLAGRASDFDAILNIGGLAYLVVMPPLLLADWLLIGLDAYSLAVTTWTHLGAALWSMGLSVVGLRRLLGLPLGLALGLAALSVAVTLPLLAIFAR